MKKIQQTLKNLWQDESGQGTLEYILLAVVMGVIVFVFKDNIKDFIQGQTEDMNSKLTAAMTNIAATS